MSLGNNFNCPDIPRAGTTHGSKLGPPLARRIAFNFLQTLRRHQETMAHTPYHAAAVQNLSGQNVRSGVQNNLMPEKLCDVYEIQ